MTKIIDMNNFHEGVMIECPETETEQKLSDCDCSPKCEYFRDKQAQRIKKLESAIKEASKLLNDSRNIGIIQKTFNKLLDESN